MPDDRFAPPPEGEHAVELEREWAPEKAQRQAVSTVAASPRRSMKPWIITSILIVVAAVVAVGVFVQMRHKNEGYTATVPRPEGTVGIQIRSNPRAMIRIDGNKAGTTPLTVHMRKGNQQIRIEAVIGGHTRTRLIVPDQDQDVAFTE